MLNLTAHAASEEWLTAGVVETSDPELVRVLVTFDAMPMPNLIGLRAGLLAEIAEDEGATAAVIGGHPLLTRAVEKALAERKIDAYYAFTRRRLIETASHPEGCGAPWVVLEHLGFMRA